MRASQPHRQTQTGMQTHGHTDTHTRARRRRVCTSHVHTHAGALTHAGRRARTHAYTPPRHGTARHGTARHGTARHCMGTPAPRMHAGTCAGMQAHALDALEAGADARIDTHTHAHAHAQAYAHASAHAHALRCTRTCSHERAHAHASCSRTFCTAQSAHKCIQRVCEATSNSISDDDPAPGIPPTANGHQPNLSPQR